MNTAFWRRPDNSSTQWCSRPGQSLGDSRQEWPESIRMSVHASSHLSVLSLKRFNTWAGEPAAITFSGMSRVTTEFAPTTAPRPIVTGPITVTLSPSQTLEPMITAPPEDNERCTVETDGRLCASTPLYVP